MFLNWCNKRWFSDIFITYENTIAFTLLGFPNIHLKYKPLAPRKLGKTNVFLNSFSESLKRKVICGNQTNIF